MNHLKQFGIAVDQVANTLIGGMADETMSARAFRKSDKYWYAALARLILDLIFSPKSRDHCMRAYLSEQQRRHLPQDYHNPPSGADAFAERKPE